MDIHAIHAFTEAELQEYIGNVAFQELLRFCIDIEHNQIVLLHHHDDHIAGTRYVLEAEHANTLKQYGRAKLMEPEVTALMRDHIIGGSIFEEPDVGLTLLIGGTSSEGTLRNAKQAHTRQALERAHALALKAFARAFAFAKTHIIAF
jgi:ribonuclease BN (tRNA processing enzyme)